MKTTRLHSGASLDDTDSTTAQASILEAIGNLIERANRVERDLLWATLQIEITPVEREVRTLTEVANQIETTVIDIDVSALAVKRK